MSDRENVVAEMRAVTGKKVKQLRRLGWVPGVLYGRSEPIHVQMKDTPLRRALRVAGTTQLIDLELEGEKHTVLVREIQQHVTRGEVVHVDFLEVDMKATIRSEAELVAVGQAQPAIDGLGISTLSLRSVDIECLPDALVSEIEVDLSLIQKPSDVIHVGQLAVPEGVTILTEPETVVARFEMERVVEEEEVEEEETFAPAADAVEVISKGKKEEEELE
ncbi:MAG: 50S ribosomal protein L25 [Anaerolineae bacterium]